MLRFRFNGERSAARIQSFAHRQRGRLICTFSKERAKLHFFDQKFGHVKKKQYLCTRNRIDIVNASPDEAYQQRWGATEKNSPA